MTGTKPGAFLGRGAFGSAAVVAVMLVVVGYLPAGLQAQSRGASSEIPDLSGTYERRGRTTGPAEPYRLHPRAQTLREVLDEAAYPKYDCVAATMPRIVTDPYNFRIEQQTDRVLLIYEKDDVERIVWLRGHGHPEPKSGEFFLQGHSVGWYEGNQLVVETTKFTYDPHGLDDGTPSVPSSQRKEVAERYWREGDRLFVEVMTEDPLMLLEPDRFGYQWELTEGEWLPYECDVEQSHAIMPFLPQVYEVQ